MTLNLCVVFRLLFGSPRLTLDLVTADSEEGSDPKVVTNYAFGEALARTPAGTVSDPRLSWRQFTDMFCVNSSIARSLLTSQFLKRPITGL